MFRRTVAVLVLVLAIGAFAADASAKKATKHKVSATIQLATIAQDSNFPAVGSSVIDAGIVKAKPGGSGAETDKLTVTAAPAPSQLTLAGTAKLFFTKGTETAKVTIQAAVQADGSVIYTGTGKFSKGTGTFKGITGNVTFTGSSPANSDVVTLQVKGSARY